MEEITKEKVTTKIKALRKGFKKALDSNRKSGGGRTVATIYKACSDIWGGCPSVKSVEGGLDSSLTEDTQSVALAIVSERSYAPQSQPLPADDSASSLVDPDDSHHSQKTNAEPATLTQPSTSDPQRRNLIEHIQENKHSKLLKKNTS